MVVIFAPMSRLEECKYLVNTHHVDDDDGLLCCVNRVVVRKGVSIVAYRSLVTAGKMGVEDKTPIHLADVEGMTKGGDIGDRSKAGDVWDGSLQEPLEPHSKSLGPTSDDSTSVEGLPVDQEPRSTTTELMAHPV